MKILFLSRDTDALKLLAAAAKKNGLDTQVVDPGKVYIVDKDGKQGIFCGDEEITPPDFCIIRDGTVDMFVKLTLNKMFKDTIFINSYEAIEYCRHKYWTQMMLNEIGVRTPKTGFLSSADQLTGVLQNLGDKYPKIIKTVTGSHGIGVIKVDSEASLKSVVQVLLTTYEELMIQEFLEHDEDYRILTIGDKAVASMVRKVPEKDFRSNLDHQEEREKALDEHKPTAKEIELAIKVAKHLKCEVSALDYAFEDDEIIVFEVNTSPGLNGIQSVEKDVDIADTMIKHLLQLKKNPIVGNDEIRDVEADVKQPQEKTEELTVDIKIKRIGNDELFTAKIDTGAGKSWLGASNVSVNNQLVTFTIGETTYRAPLQRLANVRFAGSTHIKKDLPIVLLGVKYNDQSVDDIEFIVAERKSKYRVLLGRNALNKMNFSYEFNKELNDSSDDVIPLEQE